MYYKSPQSIVLVTLQLILLFSLLSIGPTYPSNFFSFLFITAGLVLGSWSVLTMSSRSKINVFPDVCPDSNLVTAGPYKYIRHPMYTSLISISLGLFLNDFSIVRLILTLLLSWLLIYKIKLEELYLSQIFSDYQNYCNHTRRLIPWIF